MPTESPSSPATTTRDTRVQVWMFVGTAAYLVVAATVYWVASYENAGTVMLVLGAGLGALSGGWLWVQDRKLARPSPSPEASAQEPYLPHESVWPFGIGTGAFLALVGLAVSTWVLVPGALLLATSIVGFIGQTRRRD